MQILLRKHFNNKYVHEDVPAKRCVFIVVLGETRVFLIDRYFLKFLPTRYWDVLIDDCPNLTVSELR